MHEKGLLYRANRLVNWCCYMNTSLSNLEVSWTLYAAVELADHAGGSTQLDRPDLDERQGVRREGAI
jgi:hypothetical protein